MGKSGCGGDLFDGTVIRSPKKNTETLSLVSLQPQNGQNMVPSKLTTSNSTTILRNIETKSSLNFEGHCKNPCSHPSVSKYQNGHMNIITETASKKF
jgi:hypothetical protein